MFLGIRQEQDIYVRLIDSVSKQVSQKFKESIFIKFKWANSSQTINTERRVNIFALSGLFLFNFVFSTVKNTDGWIRTLVHWCRKWPSFLGLVRLV